MKNLKILILLVTLFLSNNVVEAQGIFSVRGVRGDRSNDIIKSRTGIVNITDINSLKDLPKIVPEKWIEYRGIIAYNSVNYSTEKTNIAKGFYTWNGDKWMEVYTTTTPPAGSFKGDLEALHAMQHHPKNSRYKSSEGYHKWNIDLENINNPKNLNLSGVFFREINGEQRVIEINLEDFYFQNITVTQGLEALVAFKVHYSDKVTDINLKLPNLINYYSELNESLISIQLDCPNLAYIQSKRNKKESVLNVLNCPKLFSLTVFGTRITDLDVSNNKELTYLECARNLLTSLDVSKNTELVNLSCHANKLTALDVSNNTMLREIYCSDNKIAALDVSKNKTLQILECSMNELNELNLTSNKELVELLCNYNSLKKLDLSMNTALVKVDCSINRSLTSLNISNCLELNRLMCAENKLTSLDLSHHLKLETLDIYHSSLISIPNSIKICRKSFEKIVANSYRGLHVHERGSNIYNIIDCEQWK